jgi:hypothetical protein
MSEQRRFLTIEQALYGLILAVGLGIRFFHLGVVPLSDFEAAAALPAWQAAAGQTEVALGAQPGYTVLTWLVFFLFGSSDFLARFWPAVAGGVLPVIPYLLRGRIGRMPALVLAAGLALDPGLIAAARLAGGPMMALALSTLALTLLIPGQQAGSGVRFTAAGIFLGLALLSGPSFWLGLAAFALAYLTLRALSAGQYSFSWAAASSPVIARRSVFVSGGITLLLAGTFFLRFPQGVGAIGEGLVAFLRGWAVPSGVPSGRLIAALLAYQGLVLLFALVSVWRASNRKAATEKMAGLFALSALLFVMVYPGRQVVDLVWALVPLWVLAAVEIGRQDAGAGLSRVVSAALAAVLLTLGASAWVNLARLSSQVAEINYTPLFLWNVDQYMVNLLVILGAVILMGLSYATIRMWEPDSAGRGLVWGLSTMLLLGMLASVWSVSQREAVEQRELWTPVPQSGQAGLLIQSLQELAEWNQGQWGPLGIAVDYDRPSMRWTLRDLPQVRFGSPAGDELPGVVLAPEENQDLRLATAYRGQDFIWTVRPAWELLGLDGWLRWWIFRQAPAQQEQVILWAQADLFLAGEEIGAQDAEDNSEGPNGPGDGSLEN